MLASLYHQRTSDDVSIHDQIIWNLHVNGIDELMLFLGSNPDEVGKRERKREITMIYFELFCRASGVCMF